jgi:hypothetical protein
MQPYALSHAHYDTPPYAPPYAQPPAQHAQPLGPPPTPPPRPTQLYVPPTHAYPAAQPSPSPPPPPGELPLLPHIYGPSEPKSFRPGTYHPRRLDRPFVSRELVLMIEDALRSSATSGREVTLQSICGAAACFFYTWRPGTMTVLYPEYMERKLASAALCYRGPFADVRTVVHEVGRRPILAPRLCNMGHHHPRPPLQGQGSALSRPPLSP